MIFHFSCSLQLAEPVGHLPEQLRGLALLLRGPLRAGPQPGHGGLQLLHVARIQRARVDAGEMGNLGRDRYFKGF